MFAHSFRLLLSLESRDRAGARKATPGGCLARAGGLQGGRGAAAIRVSFPWPTQSSRSAPEALPGAVPICRKLSPTLRERIAILSSRAWNTRTRGSPFSHGKVSFVPVLPR